MPPTKPVSSLQWIHRSEIAPGPHQLTELAHPFYEKADLRSLVFQFLLAAQAVSLWFITAATFRISFFPADSFFFLSRLPVTYWWGVAATLSLLWTRRLLSGRARTVLEISSIFLLALYLLGLPSFGYEASRSIDSYQHTGNAIGLINDQGWYQVPIWYLRQFPGAYTFFAQLIGVAGIDPYQLMKYYVVGIAWVVLLFIYVIARSYSPNYAAVAAGFFLGGIWFQLHISPQSLELVSYLGLLFVLLKLVTDKVRERRWAIIAVAAVPGFVASHPETPLILLLATITFLVITLPRSRTMLREMLPTAGLFLLVLLGWLTLWWGSVASETRRFVLNTILLRALSDLFMLTRPPGVPSNPSYSYFVAIQLEQVIAVTVWLLGLVLLLFIRKYDTRESLFASFFLAGISTIPVALFSKADVLQRSYLFALIPTAFLAVSLLSRKSVLVVGGRPLGPVLKAGLLVCVIGFSMVMPLTRYGIDPSEYIPQTSLYASNIVARLWDHSVLFLHPGEYGWRFYAALYGDIYGPRLEQSNITGRAGGFTKPTSVLDQFNLTFTQADGTSDYILVSDYYENLWSLRFGPQAYLYLGQKSSWEAQASLTFNLVYSTGTDRVYANRNLA